ncbi:MAG: class III signal peptide-containing protein [Candidatus Micrarchaeota archaeon]|nr:class III signal peptide-containing protein [Candidatus Micrarchaeota archaeon]
MLRGQTSVEYIILIAVVLSIGLIVLILGGFFPSFSFSSEFQSSKNYWENTSPIAIIDSYQQNSTLYLVLKNKANTLINISSIKAVYGLKEEYSYLQNIVLFPGQSQKIFFSAKNCQKSQNIFYDLTFFYSTQSVSNLSFRGTKPLYLICN